VLMSAPLALARPQLVSPPCAEREVVAILA
jgi:hypothetical protein